MTSAVARAARRTRRAAGDPTTPRAPFHGTGHNSGYHASTAHSVSHEDLLGSICARRRRAATAARFEVAER
jgi:hypothetical protein